MKKIILACVLFSFSASAVEIQEVNTPGGITAWLVESDALPMVSVEVAFRAGAAFDPPKRTGLAQYTANLLAEGAGGLNSQQFKEALEKIGAQLTTGANRLDLTLHLTTLANQAEQAFPLLGSAVVSPQFSPDAAKRVQDAMIANIKREKENPGKVAGKLFMKSLYFPHAYGHATGGTLSSVADLTEKNARWFHRQHFTKSNMVVSVVGNISARQLAPLLDQAFKNLPAGAGYRNQVLAEPLPNFPSLVRQEMQTPQTHIITGQKFIDRSHPLYYAAFVMNYILGGGSFNSRLMEEVREKNGLAYSIYSYFDPLPKGGPFVVALQTANANKALALLRAEINKLRSQKIPQDEFENALSYLQNSFPLRLDSNAKILGYLTTMQMENLGKDYLEKWPQRIAEVTPIEVQQVAQTLNVGGMVTVMVGKLPAETGK